MDTCCICNPKLPINPYVCEKHKEEGRDLAKQEGSFVSQALGELYLIARMAEAA